MIQVVYTNSNYSDVLRPFVIQNKKFTTIPLYMIADFEDKSLNLSGTYTYNNSEPYYKVWVDGLNEFKPEYFIYLQEDFYLYNKVDESLLINYENILKENKEYSFIRLIKSGSLNNIKIHDKLFEVESTNLNIFSMQPTLWRTSDYISLMNTVKEPKWFENDNYNKAMVKMGMKGLYHFNNEPKIGSSHHDSDVYPYIATAVIKGKWNYSEYKDKLEPILIENNINPLIRGVY